MSADFAELGVPLRDVPDYLGMGPEVVFGKVDNYFGNDIDGLVLDGEHYPIVDGAHPEGDYPTIVVDPLDGAVDRFGYIIMRRPNEISWYGQQMIRCVLPVLPAGDVFEAEANGFHAAVAGLNGTEYGEYQERVRTFDTATELFNGVKMSDCEFQIVVDHNGLGHGAEEHKTLDAIAENFDLTRERIRQIEARPLSRMRRLAKDKMKKDEVFGTKEQASADARRAGEDWKRAYSDYRNGVITQEEAAEYARAAVERGHIVRHGDSEKFRENRRAANEVAVEERGEFEQTVIEFLGANDDRAMYDKEGRLDSDVFIMMRSITAEVATQVFGVEKAENKYALMSSILESIASGPDQSIYEELVGAINKLFDARNYRRYYAHYHGLNDGIYKDPLRAYKTKMPELPALLERVSGSLKN